MILFGTYPGNREVPGRIFSYKRLSSKTPDNSRTRTDIDGPSSETVRGQECLWKKLATYTVTLVGQQNPKLPLP